MINATDERHMDAHYIALLSQIYKHILISGLLVILYGTVSLFTYILK